MTFLTTSEKYFTPRKRETAKGDRKLPTLQLGRCATQLISNVIPTQPSQPLVSSLSDTGTRATQVDSIDNLGPLKDVVEYTIWQLSRVKTDLFTDNIKVRDIALENCLDIKQIRDEIHPGFFIDQGVKISVTCRFVGEITYGFIK